MALTILSYNKYAGNNVSVQSPYFKLLTAIPTTDVDKVSSCHKNNVLQM